MEGQIDSSGPTREQLSRSDIALLAVGAGAWPLAVLARNWADFVHVERLAGFVVLVWLVSVLSSLGLMRMGVNRTLAVRAVFISAVMLMSGGRVLREFGLAVGWIIVIGVVFLSSLLFKRLGESTAVSASVVGLAVALASGVAVSAMTAVTEDGDDVVARASLLSGNLEARPDIFLLVVDGYPGDRALLADGFTVESPARAELEKSGFVFPESTWASYWSTQLSVASLLEMDYPVIEPFRGDDTKRSLHRVIAGNNSLVEYLADQGYRVHVKESGWSGSRCGAQVDSCTSSALLDEAMFFTLWDTVAGPYVYSAFGHAFTLGTLDTMEWLRETAPQIARDGEPSLVFAHVLAPHPPYVLDGSCRPQTSTDGYTREFYETAPGGGPNQDFLMQKECVDNFLVELAELAGRESVVVVVGDHGTDNRAQLRTPGEDWSQDALVERMNVLLAVHTPDRCRIGSGIVIPNVMREVLSCLGADADPVEPRIFKKGMIELSDSELIRLVGS